MRRLDFDEITKQLLELLLQELPMQAFFDEVYKLVRLPMNYFDTSFRLIANAFERPFYFDKWRKMDENGTFPDEEIASQNYLWYQEKCIAANVRVYSTTVQRKDIPRHVGRLPSTAGLLAIWVP